MTDDDVEEIARILQAETYPFGPPRKPLAWDQIGPKGWEFWRAKARAGVQPGQAAAEAEVVKRARGDFDAAPKAAVGRGQRR